ncbi:MAG: aldehyde dehydrogenase family protein [Pseudomonadota bacterium]
MDMHPNLIAGAWRSGAEVVDNINPSDTRDVVGRFAQSDASDAADAIAAAKSAAPTWGLSGPMHRHDVLAKVAAELTARRAELGDLLSREEGKTLPEGVAEVTRAAQIFDYFAGEALRLSGELLPSTRPGVEIEITREPMGVVGIITPWNFPMAIPAWKVAPALCFGNAVVFKPAELVPGCAWALADMIHRAGAPPGVFNLVMGRGSVVGEAMLASSDIDAVTFTGSVPTGRLVAARCAEMMRKVQLEMGGKNPLLVLDDADLDTAVRCAVDGGYFATGQRCTASSRLIVSEGIHDRFVAALTEALRDLRVDDARRSGTDIGPVVDQTQLDQDLSYVAIGRDQDGACLAFGGERLSRDTPGFYLAPALFTETTNQMRINQDEIFGPVASVIRVRDYDEALSVANDTPFGLTAGVCTTSLKYATHFKRHAQAGMVMVNLPTAGVDPHVPFGGRKGSSLGPREQGRYAREFFTQIKTAYTFA